MVPRQKFLPAVPLGLCIYAGGKGSCLWHASVHGDLFFSTACCLTSSTTCWLLSPKSACLFKRLCMQGVPNMAKDIYKLPVESLFSPCVLHIFPLLLSPSHSKACQNPPRNRPFTVTLCCTTPPDPARHHPGSRRRRSHSVGSPFLG